MTQPRVRSWQVLVLQNSVGLLCASGWPFEPPLAPSQDGQGRRAPALSGSLLQTRKSDYSFSSLDRSLWFAGLLGQLLPLLPWKMRMVKGSSEKLSSCGRGGGGGETARPQPPTFGQRMISELSACSSFPRPRKTASALFFYPFLHFSVREVQGLPQRRCS